MLEKQLRIDDAVGAIGVHGVAGVVGTLGLALLAPVANLPAGNRLSQLAVQAGGAALNFVFAFGLGLVFFLVLKRVIALRVDREARSAGSTRPSTARGWASAMWRMPSAGWSKGAPISACACPWNRATRRSG